MPHRDPNETLLVIGYGSLLSGYGLLTVRRNGKSALRSRQAFPVLLSNARRGLAKPSSHGDYLAMDLEPLGSKAPITGRAALDRRDGEIGALGLIFGRSQAAMIARREEYDPARFLELLALADRAGKPIGEFLLGVATRANFDLLAYRCELFAMLGYSSPGYIFHPLPLDDGRVAIVAIGSGYDGSGDPSLVSRRREAGISRQMHLSDAIGLKDLPIDRAGQLGYFLECLLGGVHGLWVGDLVAELQSHSPHAIELQSAFADVAKSELQHFLEATSHSHDSYRLSFGDLSSSGLQSLVGEAPRPA